MSQPRQLASEIRAVLGDQVMFVAGRNPDRPAPSHVLNNFVLAALGRGAGAESVRLLSRGSGYVSALQAHPALVDASWTGDVDLVERLAADLRTVFDPDRRVFASMGSPMPVDWQVASPDPSDDGLGRALWRCLPKPARLELRPKILRLLDASAEMDPASRLAQFVLASQFTHAADATEDPAEAPGHDLVGNVLVSLTSGLYSRDGGHRLEAMRELGILLYFVAVLAVLVDSGRLTTDSGTPEDVLGVVVYTGHPPGPAD